MKYAKHLQLKSILFHSEAFGNFGNISGNFISGLQSSRFQRYFTSNINEKNEADSTNTEETHFGFQNVSKKEKAEKVHGVFENVASNYDIMNDVMSAGIHRLWKDRFVSLLDPKPGIKLLDVAGGTGDITFRIVKYIQYETLRNTYWKVENKQRKDYDIYVCDISQGMLDVGEKKAQALNYSNIEWCCGDAQKLPFEDNTFDAYTIAYGMRNVVDVQKALSEAYRVLKPGGCFACLEFSAVSNPAIKSLYDAYSFQLIPVLGQIIAGDWDSYQYLVESIRKFPNQESYKKMIENVGFRCVRFENLTFGVTAIHRGFKI